MNNKHYNTAIVTNKSSNEIYEAVNNVQAWWNENIEGNYRNVGDKAKLTFGETYITFAVEELIPNRQVGWLVTDCHKHFVQDKKEWVGTRIIFEMTDGELVFNHYGLDNQLECFDICVKGWDFYLKESLKSLIETGQGKADRKV